MPAINRLERINLSIYSRKEKKNENASEVHPAGASRPEAPRARRKEQEKRKDGPRERSNFWAIAGQFRRVPNPPPFGGPQQPLHPRFTVTSSSSSRTTAETDVARDRAILHSLPPPSIHVRCRIFLHACRIPFSRSLFLARSINRPPAMWRDEGLVYTQPVKNRRRYNCGLRLRKTIAVG